MLQNRVSSEDEQHGAAKRKTGAHGGIDAKCEDHGARPMTTRKDESSSSESGSDVATSTTSNSDSERTFVRTIGVKTLTCDTHELEDEKMPSQRPARGQGDRDSASEMRFVARHRTKPAPVSISSSSTSASSATYKRYKFGLTNHFLTMPDMVDPQQQQQQIDQHTKVAHHHKHRKQQLQQQHKNPVSAHESNDARARDNQHQQQQQQQRAREDSDCDLSVLAPSSPDANSLLSRGDSLRWSPELGRNAAAAAASSDTPAHSSSEAASSGRALLPTVAGKKNRKKTRTEISSSGNHFDLDLAARLGAHAASADQRRVAESRLLPAGDAGLDAHRCNSKASHHTNNNLSANSSADCYSNHHHAYHLKSGASPATASRLAYSYSHHQAHEDADEAHRQHMARKRLKLGGDAAQHAVQHDECASNGLLVRLSSIMYATFLVILGCILHVSELRQKSRNSSDHIYTTIVALLGISWLLFLQGDLQRYKRYASKFILLESIFNDHQHQHQRHHLPVEPSADSGQQQQQLQRDGTGGLLGVDPSARSTSSSSTSLVNGADRLSMNTEVIFKKTAYRMYQQQAIAAPPSAARPPFTDYKLAVGNPLKYHPNTHTTDEPAVTPRLVPAYKFLHGKMGANFYLKCGMAAFCFGHVIHEGLRFGQQAYFFATGNAPCRDPAALVAHLVTPLYSFYQLFMMFKYSNLVINRHKVLARFGLMHIIGTCVTFWFRTILEEAFEDFVHKMDYFKAQNKPIIHYLDPTTTTTHASHAAEWTGAPTNAGLAHWLGSLASLTSSSDSSGSGGGGSFQLGVSSSSSSDSPSQAQTTNLTQLAQSTLLALMTSPMSATITPQLVRHLPDSYHCAQNTLLTTKSMNALPYLYPFTIEYNLLIAAIFLSLYFNIGKLGGGATGSGPASAHGEPAMAHNRCYLACCRAPGVCATPSQVASSSPPSPYYNNNNLEHNHHAAYAVSQQPGSSSGASFVGSQLDLVTSASESPSFARHAHAHAHHQLSEQEKFAGEYKSNFVVQADCHAANKGLFLGFFVLLVTLVTIVIFFVTINKPSHLQLGIKINLIQEATLTSLILIVTLAGYRQIMRLNQNPLIRNNITTDDVLMLIPLPFFFIHSLLSIRAESATLYSPHHLLTLGGKSGGGAAGSLDVAVALDAAAAASRVLALEAAGGGGWRQHNTSATNPRSASDANFMLGLASGLRRNVTDRDNNRLSNSTASQQQQQQQHTTKKMDHYKLLTIVLNLAVMIEVLVQTNFIIDGLRRCSESRYLRFKKPGRELITFAILLNITYWIVATFETKSVEQYKTEIDYYGPLPYMFISHTTLPVMLFYRYHSSVCLAEIWNRAYKPPKRR